MKNIAKLEQLKELTLRVEKSRAAYHATSNALTAATDTYYDASDAMAIANTAAAAARTAYNTDRAAYAAAAIAAN